jgi:diadenosine tetraphosphate (Ap4A) HIT family hydrolase
MAPERPCPFCAPRPERILREDAFCYAIYDINPVSKGHTLLVPRRHVADYFATTPEEKAHLIVLADQVKALLDERHHPDGYNFGVNIGVVAGQAIPHVHMHLIPRYRGDGYGRRGGMRWVIPRDTSIQKTLGDGGRKKP